MPVKVSASKEAPPTNAPSTWAWAKISFAFSGFTLPPYRMRTCSAMSGVYIAAIFSRMLWHTSPACSAVAVRPVPMAQIGS